MFFVYHKPLACLREVDAELPSSFDHDSVGSEISVAELEILHHHRTERDIWPAVLFVIVDIHNIFEEIYLLLGNHDLLHRARLHQNGRKWAGLSLPIDLP